MERTYALEEIQAIVYPILRSHGVSRAYLFGSYARGEATGKSDIDLRIDAGKIKGMFALGALYHGAFGDYREPGAQRERGADEAVPQ